MAVVIAVNAIMVTLALSTYSGLAHKDSFSRGLAYNALLDSLERQERLGWQPVIAVAAPGADGRRTVTLEIADGDGRSLAGAEARVTFVRPVGSASPVALGLSEVAAGRYAATVDLPASGQWDARISVARGRDRADFVRRIFAR
jgi:nitrogen fixation protein FixH